MVEIPSHCLGESLLDIMSGAPSELGGDPSWIDGVTPVMPGAVGDPGDQIGVGLCVWSVSIELVADGRDHLFVGAFTMAANAIASTRFTATGSQ